eukprot:1305445-Alexandrium_andersonii.AAC.1
MSAKSVSVTPPPPPPDSILATNRALWAITVPPKPLKKLPEEDTLWHDLQVSEADTMADWFK